jgi:predicted CoA-binding protein
LEKATTIAVVGLSTNVTKAAHAVPAFLPAAGFRVIPVHAAYSRITKTRQVAST